MSVILQENLKPSVIARIAVLALLGVIAASPASAQSTIDLNRDGVGDIRLQTSPFKGSTDVNSIWWLPCYFWWPSRHARNRLAALLISPIRRFGRDESYNVRVFKGLLERCKRAVLR